MGSVLNPVMYPFRTKVNLKNKQSTPEIIKWSDDEMKRIFGSDVEELNKLQKKLNEVKARSTENENRIILKQRMMEKTSKEIDALNGVIRQKIKTSIYNTKFHSAGYSVDVDLSVETNMK